VTDEREDVSPPRYDDLDADPDAGHHPDHDLGPEHEHHFFTRRHAEHHDHDPHGPRRRRGLASCLVIIVVLIIVGGVAIYAVAQGVDRVKDMFAGPEDYSGEGTGSVLFEVQEGDTTTAIGRKLEAEGVVASIEAFTDQAAEDATAARGIQVGFYELRKEMPAEAAFDVLVDPDNLVQASVTIPEGLRVEDTLKRIAKDTEISLASLKKASEDGEAIGLPAYAKNNPEGYLFPATYAIPPNADATSVLSSMVDRWRQAAEDADLEGAAKELGYTPAELMTVASLVEAEANRDEDRGKVARVIYNRLETDATNGLLQIDATVNYALGRDLGLGLTQEDLQVDSPYNTRKNPGLPPGPIESPGDAAIEAATTPTDGDWVYYVTVDLDTGETKFTEDYQEFLKYKQELLAWCETSDRC